MKEEKPKLYEVLLAKGDLEEYLTSYQVSYSQRAENIFKEKSMKRGLNEELYERNSLEWIMATEKLEEEVKAILKTEKNKSVLRQRPIFC